MPGERSVYILQRGASRQKLKTNQIRPEKPVLQTFSVESHTGAQADRCRKHPFPKLHEILAKVFLSSDPFPVTRWPGRELPIMGTLVKQGH